MTYQVRLTKVKSTHQNLRSDVIEGTTYELPKVGNSFSMFGPPLNTEASFRGVYTTEIKVCERVGDQFQFVTENSTYKLDVIAEIPDTLVEID